MPLPQRLAQAHRDICLPVCLLCMHYILGVRGESKQQELQTKER